MPKAACTILCPYPANATRTMEEEHPSSPNTQAIPRILC